MVKEAERCMKCGFCMSVCPVYSTDHIESHVARGRNVLINMVEKNLLPMLSSYEDAIYFCILCGRCESVCPAKIPSVNITIEARKNFLKKKGLNIFQHLVYRWLIFNRNLLVNFLKFISYLPGIIKKDALPLRHIADSFLLLSRELSIPKISKPFLQDRIIKKNLSLKERKGKIALFPGCAFEFFFPEAGEKIFYSLRRFGIDIVYPYGLGCCGFPVYCAGDIDTARNMARRNIEILKGYETIITGCATCASALKGYKNWLEDKEAKEVSSKVMLFSEFVIKNQIKIKANIYPEARITYHDPCHARWHQGIYEEPRKIIDSISGAHFVEMEEPDMCCGLGGSFGITHRTVSIQIQKRKIASIKKTEAQIVATECPGCMLQIQEGIIKENIPVRVMHIAELF